MGEAGPGGAGEAREGGASGSGRPAEGAGATTSQTLTSLKTGTHVYTIKGYSLLVNRGVGEAVSSEQFEAGGHSWTVHFYPGERNALALLGCAPRERRGCHAPRGGRCVASDACARRCAWILAQPRAPRPERTSPARLTQSVLLRALPRAGGYNDEGSNAEYVALSLTLASEATNLWALYTFTMVDQSGKGEDKSMGRSVARGPCKFESINFRRGKPRFIKRAELQSSGLLMNDTVVVRCEVSVVVTETTVPSEGPYIHVPPARVGEDLAKLMHDESSCDVTFIVGEERERIRAHKLILGARSDVFLTMFNSPMRQGQEEGMEVVQDTQPEVFRALLHFVYTGELRARDDTPEMSQHLLRAADFFRLDRLRLMCERRLCEKVDASNVSTTLVLADMHNAQQLKQVCLDYAAANLQGVMSSDGFGTLMQYDRSLHLEVLEAAANLIESDRKHLDEDGNARGAKRRRTR